MKIGSRREEIDICVAVAAPNRCNYQPAMKNPVQIFSKVDYTSGDWEHFGICLEERLGFSPLQQMRIKIYSEIKTKQE